MLFNKSTETFLVEELMRVELGEKGKFNYYLMQKKGIPSDKAVKLIEEASEAKIYFSGMKDANATTIQWICSEKELIAPKKKEITLKAMGKSSQKIFVGMHSGNQFNARLEKINENEKKFLSKELKKIDFPNYFDGQRFNDETLAIGNALKEKNYEKAAKIALTEKTEFESEKSKKIKDLIKKNWGKWKKLTESEEIPESKKKIFELLESNEGNFLEAVALLQPKLISISCRAAQAMEFNEQLKNEIMKQNREQRRIKIKDNSFPIEFAKNALKRKIEVQAIYPSKTRLERSTFFKTENASLIPEGNESAGKGNEKAWLSFKLRKGSYATILIKCILEKTGND